jgi:hypothetical protein
MSQRLDTVQNPNVHSHVQTLPQMPLRILAFLQAWLLAQTWFLRKLGYCNPSLQAPFSKQI